MVNVRFSKKTIIVSSSVLAAVVCIIAALLIIAPWRSSSADPSTSSVRPDFKAVLPANNTAEELGGWQKMTPPNSPPIYVYNDTLDDVAISVSQQELPEEFKTNTAVKIAELAKGYNATASINAGSTKAYIGKSASGPQSVIFTKNNLLVLIKSRGVIENDTWASYIKALE